MQLSSPRGQKHPLLVVHVVTSGGTSEALIQKWSTAQQADSHLPHPPSDWT